MSPVASYGGTITFDNSTNLLGFLIEGRNTERGDAATLAGTARFVDGISLLIHSNAGDVFGDTTVRIYDGGDTGPDPGALLWTSAVFTQMSISSGTNQYDFAVPDILVSNEMTWTVELNNVTNPGGGAVGSRFISPPTVGTSSDFVWDHTGGTWVQNVFGVGAGNNNYGAIISAHDAVPEPATLLLLGAGLAGLGLKRRRLH